MSTKYGDPAFEWEEANAVNADGQAVIDAEREAERLHLAQVADATRVWAMALGDARTAVMKAQRLHQQLDNLDFDFGESPLGRVARLTLNEAWRGIDSVMTIADGLLKPVVDAELARLRAEVDQLQRRLADHDCTTSSCEVCGDGPGDVAASSSARAILAEDTARYHGFVKALDGTLRFCAVAPGHENWCVDSDGHVIVTGADSNALCRCSHPARAHNALISSGTRTYCNECDLGLCTRYEAPEPDGIAAPIDGEGSDSD